MVQEDLYLYSIFYCIALYFRLINFSTLNNENKPIETESNLPSTLVNSLFLLSESESPNTNIIFLIFQSSIQCGPTLKPLSTLRYSTINDLMFPSRPTSCGSLVASDSETTPFLKFSWYLNYLTLLVSLKISLTILPSLLCCQALSLPFQI